MAVTEVIRDNANKVTNRAVLSLFIQIQTGNP